VVKNTSPRGTPRGFTLIELLVVIAIVTILISLLMPSLQQTRILAIRTACLSNMRGSLMSLHMYGSDYNEFPANVAQDPAAWSYNWLVPGTPDWATANGGAYGAQGDHHYSHTYNGKYVAWPILRSEGRGSNPPHWRGHLVYGKYGAATSFGCSRPTPAGYSHMAGSTNWWERNPGYGEQAHENRNRDLITAPAYAYMGPGVDVRWVAEYLVGISTHPGYGSEGAARRWKRYGKSASPLLLETFYRTWETPPGSNTYFTYIYHSKKLAFTGPQPLSRINGPFDSNIGWTDGHATSHVQAKTGGSPTIVPANSWDQGP